MRTVGEILSLSADYLHSHKVDRSKREAEDLLALVLHIKRLDLYLSFDRPLTQEELAEIRRLLKLRAEGVPFGYLAKQVAFFALLLEITPAVLVPRPETEILVDKIVNLLSQEDLEGKVLWDICTGSGCIGLALKKRFPALQVALSDISPAALAVARENAERNHLSVELYEGDLFAPFLGKKCDFLVSNPPYLSEQEYTEASLELQKEPKGALVAEEEGTRFYRRIAEGLSSHLATNGKCFLEIGATQEDVVRKIFKSSGYQNVTVENDFAGHPRFFFLE